MKNKDTVNLFFACDDNYLPFMAITLDSLINNCDKTREYQVYVLNNGLNEENKEKIKNQFTSKNFKIEYCDVSSELKEISDRLHTRDYYSKSTYYRLFTPTMFPNLNKALYLDCDIVIRGDISKLYDTPLETNLVGAVHDSFVDTHKALQMYVENRVGVKPYTKYFNAGVLLMNLEEMRKFDFKDKFLNLLSLIKFDVAQDQDYLNAICCDRVTLINEEWNFMPLENKKKSDKVNLIHFNLDYKPWHREGLLYGDLFWEYVNKSLFKKEIHEAKTNFDEEKQLKAKEQTRNLVSLCLTQSNEQEQNTKIQQIIQKIKELKEWKDKSLQSHQKSWKSYQKSTSLNEWEYLTEMLKTTQKAKYFCQTT